MEQGKKQMKKKMIKRVTIEYFEEFLSYAEDYDMPGIVPDTKRIIKVETTVEKVILWFLKHLRLCNGAF